MNGDIPNHGLYSKAAEPFSPSSVPTTQPPVRRRPSFQICGTFSGNDGIPAARWLRKLEQEFRIQDRYIEEVQPLDLLLAIDFLLTGVALEWAEGNPIVFATLTKPHPTAEDVGTIKRMMNKRFPARAVELSTQAFQNDLDSLKQKSEESLIEYYNRVKGMMERVGAKDSNASNTLSFSERTLLNGILKAFVYGISNSEVRKEAARELASSEASLRSLHLAAEGANRAQQEIRKLEAEDAKVQELQYYRNLAREKAQPVQYNSADRETQPMVRNQPRDLGYGNKPKSPATNTYPPPSKQHFEPSANLPDRMTSRNPYINGTRTWIYKQVGSLCVNCGQCGHTSKTCSELQLPA